MKKRGQERCHRIFAVFLCLCVLFTTQPEIWNRLSAFAAEEGDTKVVLSFAELSEEIKEQTVPVGTVYEELELPEELNVFMKQTEISSTPNLTEEKSEEETVSGNDPETGSKEEEADVTEQEEITVYTPENSEKEAQELQETVAGVTWQSDPAYDGNTEETYIFTAVLPEGYILAEDVSLPKITVTVKESESGTDFVIQELLERIAALPDAEEYLAAEPGMDDGDIYAEWEEKLYEYAEEALAIWEKYEELTEEQQAQMPEEELAKLEAWMEIAETFTESSQVMTIDGSAHTHCVCGGKLMNGEYNHTEEIIVYDNILASKNGQLLLNSNPVTRDEQSGYKLTSGNYYLADDVALDSELVITGGSKVYICLCGHTLSYNRTNGKHRVITVEDGATLNLCTCGDSGSITGGDMTVDAGGGLYLENATLNAYGISINDNTVTAGGGGIALNKGSHCNLYKVNIYNNKGSCGGGIMPVASYLNMYGGEIRGNAITSQYGGGIATGSTTENSILQDVKIYDNTSETYAGGLYWQASGKTLTMLNVEIFNNNVSNSTARFPAGGVALMQGTISISGTTIISGNQYNGEQNNFWNYCNTSNPSKLVISGDLDEQSVIGLTNRTAPTEDAPAPVEVASGSNYTITDADWSRFFSDKKEYKIVKDGNALFLALPDTCDLSGLDLTAEGAKLEPNFQADITTYEATVGNEVATVGITATLAGSTDGKTIKIKNGTVLSETTMTSGEKQDVPLAVGLNKIEITVASGSDTKTYTLNIKREAPAGNPVTILSYKDGVEWTGEGAPSATDYKLTSDGGTTFLPSLVAPDGIYKIYSGDTDTGVEVTVAGAGTTAKVDYYTVTFYDGDTELTTLRQQIVLNGVTASEPTDNPTKTGYTFNKWVTAKGGSTVYDFTQAVTGKTSVYASWTPISYSITYVLDGGNVSGNPTSYTIESSAITLNNPTKEGYTFAGWSGTGLTGDNNASVTIAAGSTGNREYTAHWTAAGYTVTLNGGGTGTALTGYTYGIGATLPTNWTKTGYIFAGWYNNENCTGDPVTEISATDTGDKTFWAKWTPKTYQVTFDYHGADGGNTTASQNVTYNSKYGILPVPTRTGYTFKGWYTEADGKGTEVNAGTTVTTASAHTLHAYWKDETAPDKPTLQDSATFITDWTNNQTTIPLKLYDGVSVTSLLVSVDGSPYTKVSGFSGGTGSVNYSYTDVQEGEHKYQFKAVDAAGNFAESDIFIVRLDQTKPVIGTLTYENEVHLNLWHWIIGKTSMIIHVPVTDTGSGVTKISYTLTPRDAAGNLDSGSAETKTATVTNGEAKIAFTDNFRGTIAISCTDAAGNAADGITVGKDTGGVIVEDQAPDITVQADRNISDTQRTQPGGVDVSEAYYNSAPALFVTVKDDTGNAIATGIATVTYQVWNGEVKFVSVNTGLQAEVPFEIPSTEIPTGSTKITIKTEDNAGNPAQKLITIKVKGPEKQPDAEIDYRQEELTGLLPDGEYLIEGNLYKADQEGHILIREDWLGSSISIVKKGNGSETSDSPAQNLSVPTRPQKPTPAGVDVSIAGGTGKLTGLTAGTVYEVSTDGGSTWVDRTADGNGAITGLAPGTYVVRVKAGVSSFASEKSEPAAIGAYQIKVTFMVDGAKYKEIFVDYGAALTDIPLVPAKENVVGAWCMDEQGTTPAVFTNVTADMTVYAVYTAFCTVTLQGGEGYVLSAENGSTSPVKEGGSFTFCFALREGYEKGTDFAVRINGAKVELSNDTYTIADIRESQIVTVEGVAKKPGGGSSDLPGGGGGNGNDEPQPTPPPSESTDDTPSTPPEKPPVKPTPTEPETPPPLEEKEPEGRKPDSTPEPEETPGPQEPKSNETQPPTDTPEPPADVTQPTATPETTLPAAGSEPESGKPDSTPEPEAASGPQKPIDSETQPQMPDTTPVSLTYPVGKGAVIVTLNNVDETVCAAKVTDASAVAQAVLSEEELAEVKQGQTIEIRIDVEHLETVSEEDAGVIDEGIEDCREQLPGLAMGMYVDISMYMRVGGGDWNAIRATNDPVEIVLDVPDELAELTADFYIMRAHEGEYLLMEDLDDVPETITIQTEAFSTYAILYRLQGSGGTTPAAKCSLCHICPTFLGICYFVWLAILILLILLAWIILHKRKEEQQEDKE